MMRFTTLLLFFSLLSPVEPLQAYGLQEWLGTGGVAGLMVGLGIGVILGNRAGWNERGTQIDALEAKNKTEELEIEAKKREAQEWLHTYSLSPYRISNLDTEFAQTAQDKKALFVEHLRKEAEEGSKRLVYLSGKNEVDLKFFVRQLNRKYEELRTKI